MKKYIYTLAICLIFIGFSTFAQTYATPVLKAQAEQWEAERLDWIKNNPEEYRKQGGDPEAYLPEAYIKENTKVVEKPVEVIHYKSPVNIKDKSLFKITEITALDINHKHTEQEMVAFNKEAKSEYDKFNIVIDINKNTWHYIPRDTEKKPFSKSFSLDNKILQFTNCKESDDFKFTIIEQTDNSIVLQIQPQNQGQYCVYQFTFKR